MYTIYLFHNSWWLMHSNCTLLKTLQQCYKVRQFITIFITAHSFSLKLHCSHLLLDFFDELRCIFTVVEINNKRYIITTTATAETSIIKWKKFLCFVWLQFQSYSCCINFCTQVAAACCVNIAYFLDVIDVCKSNLYFSLWTAQASSIKIHKIDAWMC